jgi:hypothetical protein
MGHLQAAEAVTHMSFDMALSWHLSSNHYPPVNPVFTPVAKEAIERGTEYMLTEDAKFLAETVVMPNGISKSYGDIIDELHLGVFVEHAYLAVTGEFEEDE